MPSHNNKSTDIRVPVFELKEDYIGLYIKLNDHSRIVEGIIENIEPVLETVDGEKYSVSYLFLKVNGVEHAIMQNYIATLRVVPLTCADTP